MKWPYLLLLCVYFVHPTFSQPQLALDEIATGFDRAVNIKHAGDDRLFVVEQDGVIRILNSDGSINATPFLDIQSIVLAGGFGDERGLLGLAFHPNYASNGFFYVNYINSSGDTMISRFSVSGDPDIADDTSEFPILSFAQPQINHNGGDLAFGPDNYLYIASGDGGDQNDPNNLGQNLNTLLGKILRIDVDGGSPYAIPGNNPFEIDGDPNTLGEIWAYGLRNPWKMSFDSLTDDFWIGDVGQWTYEEINMAPSNPAGLNYGWRCYEGNSSFNPTGCPADNTLTFPIGVYAHNTVPSKCSITGGYVYRGTLNPTMQGLYFFADWCSDEIGYAEFNGSWSLTLNSISSGNNWSAFGEDINGELYIVGLSSGTIYRIYDSSLNVPEIEYLEVKMYPNPAQDIVQFDLGISISDGLELFDIHGKKVMQLSEINSSVFEISVRSLQQGLYIVKITDQSEKLTYKKLIIN